MTDDEPRFDMHAVERREGDELGGGEYRCRDCCEVFWSPYGENAIEYCPKCGDAEIEHTGLDLVGTMQLSTAFKSWRRAKYAAEQAGDQEADE